MEYDAERAAYIGRPLFLIPAQRGEVADEILHQQHNSSDHRHQQLACLGFYNKRSSNDSGEATIREFTRLGFISHWISPFQIKAQRGTMEV